MASGFQTKLLPIVVKPENPFENDSLGREKLCEVWTQFIENSTTPFTLAIDAQWGDGKTVFLEMWKAYLENKGFRCVLLNAFRCDFYCDALPALIAEIQMQIEPGGNFKKTAKKLVKSLSSVQTASSVILAEMPGGKAAAEISRTIRSAFKEHDAVETYIAYRKAVDNFKEELAKVASQGEKGRPLVIFVDELDRCRPTFALDVLEKVKHIFDIPSIFFVFAVHKAELANIVKSAYGEINGEVYLGKFFDRTNFLNSDTSLMIHAMDRIGITSHLAKRKEWILAHKKNSEDYSPLEKSLGAIHSMFDLSLRSQEHIISALNTALWTIPNGKIIFPALIPYLTALKIEYPNRYENLRRVFNSNKLSENFFEEHLEFYRSTAGFEDPINGGDLPEEHDQLYLTLCVWAYLSSESYRENVNSHIPENSDLDRFAFPNRVSEVASRRHTGRYPVAPWGQEGLNYIFNVIESAEGFHFDDGEHNE